VTLTRLNTSVLIKTPRDCTAPPPPADSIDGQSDSSWSYSIHKTQPSIMLSRRQKRALKAPKGATPFSQPSLFAGSRAPRGPRNRKSTPRAPSNTGVTAAAAAYSRGSRSSEPRFLSRDARSMRIVHRELVTSITGSATFTVANTLALNPGIAATFPWLSVEAQGWEQYRFNKLKFCYYTRTGTSTPGSMMLVPDYDAADSAPSTEQIASAYRDVTEEVPWKTEFSCVLDPAALLEPGNRKYVRTGALASNLDIKTYDGGNFFVCTTDGTAVPWGKLWVEYDVSFFVPQLPPTGSNAQQSQHITGATPTTASLLGTQTTVASSNSLVSVSGNVLTFAQAGRFLVNYNAVSTTDTVSTPPAVAAGASLVQTYGIAGSYYFVAGNGTTNLNISMLVSTSVGGTITFANTVVGGSTAELFVTAVPSVQG
jgi:hypothetical protein